MGMQPIFVYWFFSLKLESFISSKNFLVEYLGFCMHNNITCKYWECYFLTGCLWFLAKLLWVALLILYWIKVASVDIPPLFLVSEEKLSLSIMSVKRLSYKGLYCFISHLTISHLATTLPPHFYLKLYQKLWNILLCFSFILV